MRVGVVGVDVVGGHDQVAAGAGLVGDQAAEDVRPDRGRQQYREERGRGLPVDGPDDQERDGQAQPGQEGLGEASEVAHVVGQVRVEDHDEREQRGERGEDPAAPPDPRILAQCGQPAPEAGSGGLGLRATVPRLRHVRLCHTTALTAVLALRPRPLTLGDEAEPSVPYVTTVGHGRVSGRTNGRTQGVPLVTKRAHWIPWSGSHHGPLPPLPARMPPWGVSPGTS